MRKPIEIPGYIHCTKEEAKELVRTNNVIAALHLSKATVVVKVISFALPDGYFKSKVIQTDLSLVKVGDYKDLDSDLVNFYYKQPYMEVKIPITL
jgi:hypothetical protein